MFGSNGKGLSQGDIDAITQYNNQLKQGVTSQTAWNRTMLQASPAAQHMVSSANGAAVAVEGLGTQTELTRLQMLKLRAASIALNVAFSVISMLIVQSVVKAFTHLYNIQDKLAEKTKELTSSLKSQTDEYNNLKSELDEVNKKLKDNESRYSELIEKQKESGLTTEESGELEELQRITGELTNQKNILEENIRLKKESAASTAQELANTLLKQEDVKSVMDGVGGTIKSFFNEIQESSIKMIPGFGKLYSAIDTVISLFNIEIPKDSWLNKITNIFDGTSIISWLTGTDIEEDSYDEAVSKYEDLQKKMKAIRDKYDKNGDGIIDSDASMSSEDSEAYKKYYDESVEVANNLKTEYQELDDAIKAIEADPNLTQVNKEELERLRAARDIIAEILGYNNKGKTGDGIISDEDVENANKMTVSLSDLKNASDSISALSSAFKELSDEGYISLESMSKIQEATGLSGEAWEEYQNKLMNAKVGSDEFNQTMSDLTYAILENKIGADKLANANEEYVARLLEENNVLNANEVAHDAVERAKAKQVIQTGLAKGVTDKNIASLLDEADSCDITADAFIYLVAQEIIFNSTNLSVEQQIEALRKLAQQAGLTGAALSAVLNTPYGKSGAEQKEWAEANGFTVEAKRDKNGNIVYLENGKQDWVWKDKNGNTYENANEAALSISGKAFADALNDENPINPKYSDKSAKKAVEEAEDLSKNHLEKARDYAERVADIQEDLAEKEADFAEKMAEAWKEEHLAQLKDGLEKQKDLIDRYKKNVEVLDFGLDYVEPDDFANRSDMLSSKLDKLRSYGMAMRQEFERVTQIVPQTGDEAVVLADRIEELGSAMRENVTAIRETSVELQKLSIDMASTLIENRMGELQSIMDNIDKNISILRSDYRDDYKNVEEMLFMDSLLPVSSEYDKKRKEKQKADKKLIKTEQETQDEINEIVSKSLEMQAKQNAEAREKERQKLIEDMQKAREDAQKKLAEAHQDYLDFLNENEIATSDSIQAITDMFANAHIALPEIDTSSVDRAISKVQGGVDNILSMTSAMSSIGGGDASSLGGSGSGSGSGSRTTTSSLSGSVVDIAKTQLGVPYVWGGTTPGKALDCSGLTQWAYGQAGVNLPRVAQDQWNVNTGTRVNFANLRVNDQVFFTNSTAGGKVTHTGIYVGNGQFIHAPQTGDVVKISTISAANFVGAKRYAKGTKDYGVAGENYKKEYLIDKETGEWTAINSPTLIDTDKVEVVGEKTSAKISRPLPMYALGTNPHDRGKAFVQSAAKYKGTPYVWGGKNKQRDGGLDCSGLVYSAFKDVGIDYGVLNAQGYRRYGKHVDGLARALMGDLLFFGSPSNATHVGFNLDQQFMLHSSGGSSNTRYNPGLGVSTKLINSRSDLVEIRRYADGTENYGVAGENYKKEFLVDKKTGEWTEINSPTLIDTNKVDVIGEKDSAQIGKPLPMYANGTPTTDQELLSIVNTVSGQTGVPANVLLSVIDQETGSKWYGAVMDSNGYNSYGYMMINDIHINSLNSSYASQVRNDPYTNVLEGAKILASNYNKLGNWADAASAYNQGMGGFQRNGRNQYGNDVWNRANTQAFVNAANSLSGSGSYTGGQASSDVESSGGGQVSVFGFTTYFDPGEEHGDLVDYSVAFERAGLDYSGQVVVGPNGMIYPIEYLIKLFSPAQLQKWYKQVKDGVDFSQYDIPVTMANSLYGDPREFEPFDGSSNGSSKDKSSETSDPTSPDDIEAFYDKAVDAIQKIESKYILEYTRIINDETLGNFEKTEALYNLLYEMGIESKDAGMLIYNELYDYFTKWLDDVENGTEEWSVEVYQAYRETLRDIIDDANERVTMAVEKKQEAADMRWDNSSGWIEDRNYYGDWALFRDNEVAAWERVVKWLHEEYPNESGKIREAEQYLFAARKKELETATSFGNTYLESKKTLLQSYYDVTNSIAEAQHEINKELETSMTMYEYLDEDTRKLLFNQEDYNVLAEELVDIQYKANKLQRQYENDLSNASLATAESITANYQRQYETLMKSYEVAKADLEVAKKKQALNNVLNERNVRMFVNGSWQWVANTQSVADAKSALADAEFAKQKEETGLTQQNSLNNLTKQQDNLSVTMKLLETGVISLKEAVEMAAGAMSSWRFPKDIQQMLWNAAVDTESYVQGSSSRSHEGVWYDTLVDYMAEIPNADSEREAIAYNEARTAKIKGEGLEYDPLTNKEASEKWEIADNNRRYKNLFDSFSKENKGVSFQKLFPEFSNESKSNIFSNIMGEGVAFKKLFPDYFDEVSKKMNASWDASLNVGFNGTNQQTQDNRTIIHNQDNRTIVDNLTIEGATGQALANALRNELHTT